MAELSTDTLSAVTAACREGAAEAAAAIERALGAEVGMAVGEAACVSREACLEQISGAGLMLVFTVGGQGALWILPDSSGLVPPWCAQPDPSGESRLTTLAQELGLVLLPESHFAEDFAARHVPHIGTAAMRAQLADEVAVVPLEFRQADGRGGMARLVWPAAKPLAALVDEPVPPVSLSPPPRRASLGDLPIYTRSLLRIEVPVTVKLAEQRQPLSRILDLSPGAIIQFEKSCDEMLELVVGGRTVAQGEAVKVGDKFGLRVTSMILPEERFTPVKRVA